MSKDEMIKQAFEKNRNLVKQVKELKKKDPSLPIAEACKRVNWTFSQYYTTLKKMGKSPGLTKPGVNPKKTNYPAKRKSPTKLTVTTLPEIAPRPMQGFMLYGEPAVLAAFARSYEQA